MAVSAFLFGKAFGNMLGGAAGANARQSDYLSDTIKRMLTTSTYTPNRDTHELKADVTNEVVGTGYTAGGAALASKTITYTAADSWGTARANTTAYVEGDVVRPATPNAHLYRCIIAGTSAAAPPTFPTVSGNTVADGTVTWAEIGSGITQVDSADVSWPASTITARYAVDYNDTPTDKPLFNLTNFGADFSSNNGTFQVTNHALGIFVFSTP